jgi:hypothetical protein
MPAGPHLCQPLEKLVNAALTMAMRHFERQAGLRGGQGKREHPGKSVHNHVHVQDRAALADANDLIVQFGEHARLEAASRADRSRSLGNVIHFCHWRQIERTIEMLSGGDVTGTVH